MAQQQQPRHKTGLVYDARCLLHVSDTPHAERPERAEQTWALLKQAGITSSCTHVPSREVTLRELSSIDKDDRALSRYIWKLDNRTATLAKSSKDVPAVQKLDDNDTYFGSQSLQAARLAVGGLTDLTVKVMAGELANGFAVIRPPGHHSNNRSGTGFCILNNVACAIQLLRASRPQVKVAVFDFDAHHGDGTQQVFYKDPNVLVCSIHRHDHGAYFPGTGGAKECGEKRGKGYNVNIPLNVTDMGDAEYLLAMDTVVLPIFNDFQPDIILVSAGIDCAHDDRNGADMRVSIPGFAHMTERLMRGVPSAKGRVVMALEGGYSVWTVAQAVMACVQTLMGKHLPSLPSPNWFLDKPDHAATLAALQVKREQFALELQQVRLIQRAYWPSMR